MQVLVAFDLGLFHACNSNITATIVQGIPNPKVKLSCQKIEFGMMIKVTCIAPWYENAPLKGKAFKIPSFYHMSTKGGKDSNKL